MSDTEIRDALAELDTVRSFVLNPKEEFLVWGKAISKASKSMIDLEELMKIEFGNEHFSAELVALVQTSNDVLHGHESEEVIFPNLVWKNDPALMHRTVETSYPILEIIIRYIFRDVKAYELSQDEAAHPFKLGPSDRVQSNYFPRKIETVEEIYASQDEGFYSTRYGGKYFPEQIEAIRWADAFMSKVLRREPQREDLSDTQRNLIKLHLPNGPLYFIPEKGINLSLNYSPLEDHGLLISEIFNHIGIRGCRIVNPKVYTKGKFVTTVFKDYLLLLMQQPFIGGETEGRQRAKELITSLRTDGKMIIIDRYHDPNIAPWWVDEKRLEAKAREDGWHVMSRFKLDSTLFDLGVPNSVYDRKFHLKDAVKKPETAAQFCPVERDYFYTFVEKDKYNNNGILFISPLKELEKRVKKGKIAIDELKGGLIYIPHSIPDDYQNSPLKDAISNACKEGRAIFIENPNSELEYLNLFLERNGVDTASLARFNERRFRKRDVMRYYSGVITCRG